MSEVSKKSDPKITIDKVLEWLVEREQQEYAHVQDASADVRPQVWRALATGYAAAQLLLTDDVNRRAYERFGRSRFEEDSERFWRVGFESTWSRLVANLSKDSKDRSAVADAVRELGRRLGIRAADAIASNWEGPNPVASFTTRRSPASPDDVRNANGVAAVAAEYGKTLTSAHLTYGRSR